MIFTPKRCTWCLAHPLYIDYHDKEWGTPIHDPLKLFEFIILEGMQAGLNWLSVLKKRQAMEKAFLGFDPEKLACLKEKDLQRLLNNPDIIRNRLKIAAVKKNAQAFLDFKEGNFSEWIWQFTDGRSIQNHWQKLKEVPAITKASEHMAKALKKQGFCFVGPTTCYAFMQAVGMVNDHLTSCFRYQELKLRNFLIE